MAFSYDYKALDENRNVIKTIFSKSTRRNTTTESRCNHKNQSSANQQEGILTAEANASIDTKAKGTSISFCLLLGR
jgi:hypothetical protein